MIRALIFDFDGLILETETPVYQSWRELYTSLGCQLSFDKWADTIGKAEGLFDPFDDIEEQMGRTVNRETLGASRRQRELELIARQPALPGVQVILDAAIRMSLMIGLASSSSCDWVSQHLTRLSLFDYFDTIKASDDVVHTKPDPDLYYAVLAALDLKPDQAIVFEDSPNGILAAKRAGLFCVAVPNQMTARLNFSHADMRLNSLADLPLEELIRKVEKRLVAS